MESTLYLYGLGINTNNVVPGSATVESIAFPGGINTYERSGSSLTEFTRTLLGIEPSATGIDAIQQMISSWVSGTRDAFEYTAEQVMDMAVNASELDVEGFLTASALAYGGLIDLQTGGRASNLVETDVGRSVVAGGLTATAQPFFAGARVNEVTTLRIQGATHQEALAQVYGDDDPALGFRRDLMLMSATGLASGFAVIFGPAGVAAGALMGGGLTSGLQVYGGVSAGLSLEESIMAMDWETIGRSSVEGAMFGGLGAGVGQNLSALVQAGQMSRYTALGLSAAADISTGAAWDMNYYEDQLGTAFLTNVLAFGMGEAIGGFDLLRTIDMEDAIRFRGLDPDSIIGSDDLRAVQAWADARGLDLNGIELLHRYDQLIALKGISAADYGILPDWIKTEFQWDELAAMRPETAARFLDTMQNLNSPRFPDLSSSQLEQWLDDILSSYNVPPTGTLQPAFADGLRFYGIPPTDTHMQNMLLFSVADRAARNKHTSIVDEVLRSQDIALDSPSISAFVQELHELYGPQVARSVFDDLPVDALITAIQKDGGQLRFDTAFEAIREARVNDALTQLLPSGSTDHQAALEAAIQTLQDRILARGSGNRVLFDATHFNPQNLVNLRTVPPSGTRDNSTSPIIRMIALTTSPDKLQFAGFGPYLRVPASDLCRLSGGWSTCHGCC